ncbi:CDK5 regulatory subunit-associated protein 1 [Fasciolopsis buskii]|uniref:CDK5 regulatory subunit-associated protein 1 n=1 Tax=Fasciolopsis buskii TaxID=27845 RepID=A0A8E0VMJ0_9TREM|nr:CDK5 regulatory subunit-associated protein 1 [Fasciolopsis buski]
MQKTRAYHRLVDDVPKEVKMKRFEELRDVARQSSLQFNEAQVGRIQLILIEGISRRSPQFVYGRNDFNIKVIVPRSVVPLVATQGQSSAITLKPGDYCVVKASDILRIHRFPSKNCIFGQRYSTYQHQAHNPEITSIRLSLLCIHHASPLVNSYCKNRRSCV